MDLQREPLDIAALNDELRQISIGAGCAGFGICDVAPFPSVREEMNERSASGMAGSLRFTYTDSAVATDVRNSWPWAAGVVVVAWPYLRQAGSPGPPAAGEGRIARFATEDHYRGLRAVLDAMVERLADAGYRAEPVADDRRLVDRAVAVRAGVGWWGKNSMVLAPGVGPWFLIGSVITDAPLEASAPMVRDCGSCSACIPACPTGALVAPGILDARLCLAYWLQSPGRIPIELRRAVGDRLYGCDDCIEACPPGRKELDAAPKRRDRVDLYAVLAAPDRRILDRFQHFYIPKRRAGFVRRNALIALTNSVTGADDQRRERAVNVLVGYLGNPDWVLRAHAAWGLGVLGGPIALAALVRQADIEPHPEVREELAAALAGIDDARRA